MISDERLRFKLKTPTLCTTDEIEMAKELLALRKGREIPEGWKLVPVEPTKQMLEASYREASVYSPTAYRAMLAAADLPNLSPVRNCLAFFASAIKSGESWSSTCQRDYEAALSALRNIEEAK